MGVVRGKAQGSMDLCSISGVGPDLGAGATDAGTIRTVESSDSPLVAAMDALAVSLADLPVALDAATPFTLVAAGVTEDKTVVKASAGTLKSLSLSNVNAAACYVKFYNQATEPDVSSDIPVQVWMVPGNTAGAVLDVQLPLGGVTFSTGISFVIVTGSGDTNATEVTAGEVTVAGSYV